MPRHILALLIALFLPTDALPQSRAAADHPADELPPISFVCPMHLEAIDGVEGICPICKMDLVTSRIELAYTCPVHGVIHMHGPGTVLHGAR